MEFWKVQLGKFLLDTVPSVMLSSALECRYCGACDPNATERAGFGRLAQSNQPMNVEETAEQKVRRTRVACAACGSSITIGPNYPEGVPLPKVLELWCGICKTISLTSLPDPK